MCLQLCASLFVSCVVVGFCFVFNFHSMRNLWGVGGNFAACRFLAVYTYVPSRMSHWVCLSLYILKYLLNWIVGRFVAIYTYTTLSLRRWVGVCRNISYIYLLHRVAGLEFLSIYSYISSSVSRWVGVSLHIYLYIVFSESLSWGFSPYILIYRL